MEQPGLGRVPWMIKEKDKSCEVGYVTGVKADRTFKEDDSVDTK